MIEAVTKRAALRVSEVAQMCGVTERTILAWIARGELPAARCGRTFLVPRAAIETLLAVPPGWPETGGRYL
jgi:excisionase family DNA binding protein